jgi:hypothetical protein
MAWTTDMVMIVRGLINDMVSPYSYSDERLEQLICVGAVLTMQDVDFDTSYTVDLSAFTITPDPSVADDADFEALVSLKTACIIAMGEHKDAAKTAISVKDGPAFVDTKERAKHLEAIADDACSAYEKAKINYQIGDGSLGRAIVGPYNAGQSAETGRGFS